MQSGYIKSIRSSGLTLCTAKISLGKLKEPAVGLVTMQDISSKPAR